MTLGIVVNCSDGVVVGSDKKVVQDKGVQIQRLDSKVQQYNLAENCLVLCTIAGASTVGQRILARIDPQQVDEQLDFWGYMSEVVERIVPAFASSYLSKHGNFPNTTIALGGITRDPDGNCYPIGATVYGDGNFDYEFQYTAIGSGSLIAEILLRDAYSYDLTIERGRELVAYVIHRVSEVDSNVEGFHINSINLNGEIESIDNNFLIALQMAKIQGIGFQLNIEDHLNSIREVLNSINTTNTHSEENNEE